MEYSEDLKRSYRTVQNSGITNMFDRKAVQYYAFQVDMYEFVSFLQGDRQDYIDLQKNVDWETIEPYEDKLEKLIEIKEKERQNSE